VQTSLSPTDDLVWAIGEAHVILLVEDDDATRDVMAAVLRSGGHDVQTAANGREALDLLDGDLPSVIFSDLDMPVMSGWAFRRFQLGSARLRGIPFVIVSAMFTVEEDGRELVAAMALRKPVEAADLLECARRFDQPAPASR